MTLRVAADLVRRALGDLLAVVQDRDPVADPHDHPHVVLDEQDRQPEVPAEAADERGHLRRSRSGSCRRSARRAAAASARCASARASSSRRWSPYGRFLASSSSRPRRPTRRRQLARPAPRRPPPRAAARGVRRASRRRMLALSCSVHAHQDVLERGHVLEQADVLEGAADARPRPCRSGGRCGRCRAGARRLLYQAGRMIASTSDDHEEPERDDDGRDQTIRSSLARRRAEDDRERPRRCSAGRTHRTDSSQTRRGRAIMRPAP